MAQQQPAVGSWQAMEMSLHVLRQLLVEEFPDVPRAQTIIGLIDRVLIHKDHAAFKELMQWLEDAEQQQQTAHVHIARR